MEHNVDMWKECLRVLKPGGFLLSFGGTRTYHRIACAIEDAGFEIRDMIEWVYASGFPKSLNIGKSVNQLETNEWLKISKSLDNIEKKSIIEVWKSNSNNVKIVETQSLKNQTIAGQDMPSESFVVLNVVQNSSQENSNLLVSFAEQNLNEVQAINTKTNIALPSVEVEIRQLQYNVNFAEKQSQNQNHKSWNIFTAQCDVKEWLSENTEVNHKVDEVLKTLRGNKKYSNEEITNVLCVALTEILKFTILNQSKTFQNLGTTQKMECVSAINAIITEYTAENLISNTVAILKSKAVDKLQGNEREVVGDSWNMPDLRDVGKKSKEAIGIDKLSFSQVSNAERKIDKITKGTSEWEGWGTALKPAHEPICMARKPLGQQELDIAKNICYNITEKGLITNSKIIWRIKNVKGAEKQKKSNYSTPTQLQKTVEVSAEFVEMKGNESVGKKIQKLIDSICESGIQETGNKPEKQVLKAISKTKIEYQDTGENINTNEKQKLLKPTEESASVVENQDLSSLPLTTLEVVEDSTEKKSKMETSMSFLKSTDTQKTDTDCYAQTATSQWVCMDIVRTLKVSFEGKEYDFIELSDGSLVWNENLEPYRKQQKLNVAENCLKWGTGGININDCKVKFNIDIEPNTGDSYYLKRNKKYPNKGSAKIMGSKSKRVNVTMTQGRFPANLIHDGSDEVLEYFPQSKGACSQNNSSNINIYKGNSFNKSASKLMGYRDWYNDNGSAARFFYCAKASKTERNMGCEELEEKRKDENRNENFDSIQSRLHGSIPKKNNHPTVKPIKLMEYLIKLVSREGSLIYDPFAGSGSTLIAAKKLGRNFIGSEINPDYVKIAENRISKEIHFKEAT